MVCVALAAAALLAGRTIAQDEKPAETKPESAKSEPAKPDAGKPDAAKDENPEKPSETSADAPKAGDKPAAVLKASRDKLLTFRSIKAKLVETVALGNRRFKAEGTYQQGSNLKLRLDFTVQSGETKGSLLEVCDGQVLWTRYTVGETSRITRRDVREILNAISSEKKPPANPLVAEIGLGGLPALMASVENSMTFRSVRQEEIDGQSFTVLDGIWNKAFMDAVEAGTKSKKLPEHVPDSLRLYLDTQTLLPRRFLYLKRDADTKQNRPMVTLDFVDLVLNAPISDDEFYFIPPEGVPQDDITQRFIDSYLGPRTPAKAKQ